MTYTQFSREHLQFCMANQSMLIDQFYKELQIKRRIKREKALQQMEKAKAKQPTLNIK
jgi:hypothetical protein